MALKREQLPGCAWKLLLGFLILIATGALDQRYGDAFQRLLMPTLSPNSAALTELLALLAIMAAGWISTLALCDRIFGTKFLRF